jgi:hypothetical protein
MAHHDTQSLASRPGHLGRVTAARILAAAFGIGAGLLGLEHGFFETQ